LGRWPGAILEREGGFRALGSGQKGVHGLVSIREGGPATFMNLRRENKFKQEVKKKGEKRGSMGGVFEVLGSAYGGCNGWCSSRSGLGQV
jgi:hypothetical protein